MVCKFTPLCKSKFAMRSRGKKRSCVNLLFAHIFEDSMMNRQLCIRRQMPFYLSTGLNFDLSLVKSVASRPKSRVWWTEIVGKWF